MKERKVGGTSNMNKEGKNYARTVTEEGYFLGDFASAHEDTRSC